MKKIQYNKKHAVQIFGLMTIFVLLSACIDNNNLTKPIVTEVRNYATSPNDTLVQTISTGQWVVLLGKNLSGVSQVYFGSIPATINTSLFTDESIVVQIPSIPFQTVDPLVINEITVVSKGGATTFKINIVGSPIISHVRNYELSPNDTITYSIVPGQQINLVGYNLKDALSIDFQGVEGDLSNIIYTDTSAIVTVPIDLSNSDASKANTISYTTNIGTGIFSIRIIGPPIILYISNENPNPGDSVYLLGNNFLSIQSLTFAGEDVSLFKASADGSLIGFVAPSMSQSGPVVISTVSGQFTTAYNVNDVTTGIIGNMEWGDLFGYAWWGGADLISGDPNSEWPPYNPDFTGNSSMFLELKNNVLDAGAGDEGVALRLSGAQWVPEAKLTDPVGSWVLKFEINIPKPWNGGTVNIRTSNSDYRALWAPWKISSSGTKPVSTKGWQTVVIPLTLFRTSNGTGTSAPSLSTLLGNSGNSELVLYINNSSTSPTGTGFDSCFDNFRVVKQ